MTTPLKNLETLLKALIPGDEGDPEYIKMIKRQAKKKQKELDEGDKYKEINDK